MVQRHDTVNGTDGKPRCGWASADPLYQKYHDTEWGRPLKDDRALFELLTLEGCQAGLSWITVLRKREHYRKVYDGFDPKKIARYTPAKFKKLLADPGIIRHKGKIDASVSNAEAYLSLVEREAAAEIGADVARHEFQAVGQAAAAVAQLAIDRLGVLVVELLDHHEEHA